jgi:hypothetical protein
MLKTLLFAYYVLFVLDTHPQFMRHGWQRKWVYDTAHEVAEKTNAAPDEGLRMMQIASQESGFDPHAIGNRGERGRWQVLGGKDFSAKEALRRMRIQGMVGFVGCRKAGDKVTLPNGVHTTCQEMIDDRIGPADSYFSTHRAPVFNSQDEEMALEQ